MFNIFKTREPLVLLVDDDCLMLEMYEAFLEDLKCKSIKTSEGETAQAMAQIYKPQLIVLDIMMPRITGLQILKSLKLEPSTKKIPVLMITGEQKVDDLEAAFKLGAADYLVKPPDRISFENKVKTLLSSTGYSFPGAKQ